MFPELSVTGQPGPPIFALAAGPSASPAVGAFMSVTAKGAVGPTTVVTLQPAPSGSETTRTACAAWSATTTLPSRSVARPQSVANEAVAHGPSANLACAPCS